MRRVDIDRGDRGPFPTGAYRPIVRIIRVHKAGHVRRPGVWRVSLVDQFPDIHKGSEAGDAVVDERLLLNGHIRWLRVTAVLPVVVIPVVITEKAEHDTEVAVARQR